MKQTVEGRAKLVRKWLRKYANKTASCVKAAFTVLVKWWKWARPYFKTAIRCFLRNPVSFWIIRKIIYWAIEDIICPVVVFSDPEKNPV